MGYFAQPEIEVMERAYELGDDFGDNQAALDRICEEFGLTEDEVLNILQGDYDTDPAEYA